MDAEERARSGSLSKAKKPGPRPTPCMWCNSTDCTHCRCTGQNGCGHKRGEMCPNPRFKRRLVCNSCEKVKLREEAAKRTEGKLSFSVYLTLGVKKERRVSLQVQNNTRGRTATLPKKSV